MRREVEIGALRAALRPVCEAGRRIALVPTMGNLHAGHLSLVEAARAIADFTVVSIFVNPLQFGPNEDFDGYPRTLEEDTRRVREAGADLLFCPQIAALYPRGQEHTTQVEVPDLGGILCGKTRPVHFRGVATVVNILFNIVRPDVAVFGAKDYQQCLVIRRMVEDLHLEVEIVAVPTVREPDGLAMSSRNGYLGAEERARAPALYRAISEVRAALHAGRRDFAALENAGRRRLEAEGLRPDYLVIRRAADLGEPAAGDEALVVLGAAWLGRARLIDNVVV